MFNKIFFPFLQRGTRLREKLVRCWPKWKSREAKPIAGIGSFLCIFVLGSDFVSNSATRSICNAFSFDYCRSFFS